MRVPVKVFGDLRAQLAACHIAEQAIHEMAARYGEEKLAHYMTELVDYAERMTRAAISDLPDGDLRLPRPYRRRRHRCRPSDSAQGHDHQSGRPYRGRLDRQFAAGQGRDQQHAQLHEIGELLRNPLDPAAEHPDQRGRVPRNRRDGARGHDRQHGVPGACAARGLTGFRMVDCMFGALAKMLPDQVFAASDGGNTGVSIGGWHRDRTPFIYVDFTCCAWGARPYADGLDGNSHIYANMASQPIEVTESEQPCRSPPTSSSKTRWVPANSAAARRSVANTGCWPTRRYCRCAPTATPSARSVSMAAAPGARR